ncbi:zinc-binding dehydrogenase [Rhodopseudomonas sp. P2A-2r]|uniref:zinc-binding dehydrogenase n=1 Tax=unclassified Rhodopseudomonas TaxID=2638247 RepID=UPI0029FF066A|nr:zinc-binding dehydrogenase [Rhodopseudomonas sp. P2A-2r]
MQIAKHLGARQVIATGRNSEALEALPALGADVIIPLGDDEANTENVIKEQFAAGVDVVIDYLWGRSAERLLIAGARAGRDAVPIRFVQVGAASGTDITLPAAVLRSSAITLMGSGIGSVPLDRMLHAIDALLRATVQAGFQIRSTPVPLSDLERAWGDDDSTRRTVFIADAPTS